MNPSFKILLATDYSEAVMNAERYALQLAKATNAELCIMHTYEIPLSAVPAGSTFEFVELRDNFHNQAQKILDQHYNNLIHSLGIGESEIVCDCIVREGSVAKEVCREAKKWEADIVIVGTHGSGGFKNVLYGTHAWEIIKKADLPVLAIPKDGLFTGLKNIVFALEQRKGEVAALRFVIDTLKDFEPEVTAIHITSYVISKEFELKIIDGFMKEIKNELAYEKLSLRIEHHDDIIQGLTDFCLNTKADLLVMSPEKISWFEKILLPSISITRRMSFHTHIPLLSVPDFYVPHKSKIPETFDLNNIYVEE